MRQQMSSTVSIPRVPSSPLPRVSAPISIPNKITTFNTDICDYLFDIPAENYEDFKSKMTVKICDQLGDTYQARSLLNALKQGLDKNSLCQLIGLVGTAQKVISSDCLALVMPTSNLNNDVSFQELMENIRQVVSAKAYVDGKQGAANAFSRLRDSLVQDNVTWPTKKTVDGFIETSLALQFPEIHARPFMPALIAQKFPTDGLTPDAAKKLVGSACFNLFSDADIQLVLNEKGKFTFNSLRSLLLGVMQKSEKHGVIARNDLFHEVYIKDTYAVLLAQLKKFKYPPIPVKTKQPEMDPMQLANLQRQFAGGEA